MSNPAVKPAADETMDADRSDGAFAALPTDDISAQVREKAPFPTPPAAKIRRDGDTEDLLNGLIAECHFLMRELAMPSACQTGDPLTRQQFIDSAMNLAVTGANVGKVVAKLRAAGQTTEMHQRQITERFCRAAPEPGEHA